MKTTIKWDYQHKNGTTEMNVEAYGSIPGVIAAVGHLIQSFYNQTPDPLRPAFQSAIKCMVEDDSPVWRPEKGVKIDMNALKKYGGRQRDD